MFIDSNNNPWFSVSEFNIQSYCELQLKYRWSGIKPITQAMIQGTKRHKQLETKFIEETKDLEEVTIPKTLELAMHERDFEPTNSPKKCASCSYRETCNSKNN